MNWVLPLDLPVVGKRLLPATTRIWDDNTQKLFVEQIKRIVFTKYGTTIDISVKPFFGKVFPDSKDFVVFGVSHGTKEKVEQEIHSLLLSYKRGY